MPREESCDPLSKLRTDVVAAAATAAGKEIESTKVSFERPPQMEFGDYSTNAAMLFASGLDRNPREFAAELVVEVETELKGLVERVEIAGPGFINLFLSDLWYRTTLAGLVKSGDNFGAETVVAREQINVEFVSANPTGPLHIGHARHAAYGDSLVRVLDLAGHKVTREFYVNDFGSQIERFGASIAARIKGEDVPDDGYKGEYIDDLAERLNDLGGEDTDKLARSGIELMLESIRASLERFRVEFDLWSHERTLYEDGKVQSTLDRLTELGHTYESDGALWLKTTVFGDDKDRVLRRSDGDCTYFAADIAYHQVKRNRGFDRLIDIWGADHHGYVARMRAAFAALGADPDRLELIIMQLVQLLEAGEIAQMSKRSGEFVSLDDLVDDIGIDAARFFLLQRSHDTTIDLELTLARHQSQDNPVYYVQYAHARAAGILSKARIQSEVGSLKGTSELHSSEKQLIKKLVEFPDLVREISERRTAHKLTVYALELAQQFTAFYRDCKVVGEPTDVEQFRVQLVFATKQMLGRTLGLIGVEAPDQM